MSNANKLLVVESPAKAKTIHKFLGPSFIIKASMGHVRDIPHRAAGTKFGIDLEHDYKPVYEPLDTRKKVLSELKDAAKKVDEIYLAPDPDREGEAIAWHLQEALKLPPDKTYRVTFNSITRAAVQNAIKNPGKINMDLVDAQQGRRVLDRLVGFSLSPFLWKKITKGLSAGRVQSVAARLIVEREREISAFKPEEFWRLTAELSTQNDERFFAQLVNWRGEKFALGAPAASNEKSARAIVAQLEKAAYQITALDKREVKTRPGAPFITSTLQQAASTTLYFGAKKTMTVAQKLYEGIEVNGALTGLITYMRTDSTRLAPEALSESRKYIGENYAPAYLPEKPNFFTGRKDAQDAHEAIRPTNVFITPAMVAASTKERDIVRLYDLIWRRFVASQMAASVSETTTATIAAGDGILEAKGKVVLFDGYTILEKERQQTVEKVVKKVAAAKKIEKKDETPEDATENQTENQEQTLPRLAVGDALKLRQLTPAQHFTAPPPRYSEASLVRALEKEGIGRPSTYATIVQTIQDRGYAQLKQRRFYATELGLAVNDILVANFPQVMDLHFTAELENELDEVEEGKRKWQKIVDGFYRPLAAKIADATKNAESLKGQPAPNGEKCPQCGGEMVVRYSAHGAFLGCANYPTCKGVAQMANKGGDAETGEVDPDAPTASCPKCGAPMTKKRSKYGDFMACANYPACKQTLPINKDGKVVELPVVKLDCEKCGKPLITKLGKTGPFLACSGYPECKNTKFLDKNGKVLILPDVSQEKCEKCGAPMAIRMSRRGPFLGCSAFPKCRNAKPMPKEK